MPNPRTSRVGAGALLALALTATAPAASPTPVSAAGLQAGRVHLVVAPGGNEARYRVREQLAGLSFPNDAVGATAAITGGLVIEAGKVVPAESRFTVDITGLKSDEARRDRYIQLRTLETARFPAVTLAPRDLRGLPWPLPASGPLAFELIGDLTVHGTTKSTTWQVKATAESGGFRGTAATRFTFGDFGMTKPSVAIVLSVEDDIRLEFDFHLIPAR